MAWDMCSHGGHPKWPCSLYVSCEGGGPSSSDGAAAQVRTQPAAAPARIAAAGAPAVLLPLALALPAAAVPESSPLPTPSCRRSHAAGASTGPHRAARHAARGKHGGRRPVAWRAASRAACCFTTASPRVRRRSVCRRCVLLLGPLLGHRGQGVRGARVRHAAPDDGASRARGRALRSGHWHSEPRDRLRARAAWRGPSWQQTLRLLLFSYQDCPLPFPFWV